MPVLPTFSRQLSPFYEYKDRFLTGRRGDLPNSPLCSIPGNLHRLSEYGYCRAEQGFLQGDKFWVSQLANDFGGYNVVNITYDLRTHRDCPIGYSCIN